MNLRSKLLSRNVLLLFGGAWSLLLLASGYWLGYYAHGSHLAAIAPSKPFSMSPADNRARPLPMAMDLPPGLSAGSSPEKDQFLQNRALLMQKMEELRKKSPDGVMDPAVMAEFRRENADLLQKQNELGRKLALERPAGGEIAPPPPMRIPPGASPQMKTFLTERDQLVRDQIQVMNQYRNASPKDREEAIQKWRQENAERFKQLQEMALAMSKTNAAGGK